METGRRDVYEERQAFVRYIMDPKVLNVMLLIRTGQEVTQSPQQKLPITIARPTVYFYTAHNTQYEAYYHFQLNTNIELGLPEKLVYATEIFFHIRILQRHFMHNFILEFC